jgi:CBS domain-containing protein
MALCASVAGQKPAKLDKNSCQSQVKITRTIDEAQPAGAMALVILDVNGAVVTGADVVISQSIERLHSIDKTLGPVRSQTNDEGRVVFTGLAPGNYDVKVEVASRGFMNFELQDLDVKAKEAIAIDVTVQVDEGGGLVGIVTAVDLPLLIEKPRAGVMIIPGDVLRRLPY